MHPFKSLLLAVSLCGFAGPVFSKSIVRINPLGDSITGSPGCWRALLWRDLQRDNVTNTDFVGTLPAQNCGFTYDGRNDGHGGYLATDIANDNLLVSWLNITKPDVVMMQLGTNDVWRGHATAEIITAFTKLVGQMRASKPDMYILVAQITPLEPWGCVTCPAGAIALNAAIPAWAKGMSTKASPIKVVDCFTGYSCDGDTTDGVHPTDSGNAKLANAWFRPLKHAIRVVGESMKTEGEPVEL